ncbi:hypothetical protein HS053_19685, partial [Tabrizicola sp. SY72]|nr:hypothetical protein [Tabrizicola sp. SY72]
MAVLFRLRWRLAHLICPELGVEARLSALRTLNDSVVIAVRVEDVVP